MKKTLLVLCLALTCCSRSKEGVPVKITGDVRNSINGSVTDQKLSKVDASTYFAALGMGRYKETKLIGDLIITDHEAHISVPEGNYNTNGEIDTPFLIGIAEKPSHKIEIKQPIMVAHFYNKLLDTYTSGFVIYGRAEFAPLNVTFAKMSPIYGQKTVGGQNDAKYIGNETYKQIEGTLFGVVMPKDYVNPQAFFPHPMQPANSPLATTYILTNRGARHLLMQSVLLKGELYIEAVARSTQ